MTLSEAITSYRTEHGLSQRQFAQKCDLSNGYIAMLEKNINPKTGLPMIPTIASLAKLANGMGITLHQLLGSVDDMPVDISVENAFLPIERKKIRMLGNVACGEPIWANEEQELYVVAGADIDADFALQAKGDSMINARIYDGDIVFVRQQEMVDNGEIAVVLIDDEATLKRVYYDRNANTLQLVPENPKYPIMRYFGEELNRIRILGKAIAFQSDIR